MLDAATIASLAHDPAALQAAIVADAAATQVAQPQAAQAGTAVIPAVNLEQLPAHLQQIVGTDTSAADMGSATDRNRISIKGKVFTMTGSDGKDNIYPMGQELELVILATDPAGKNTAKAFYPGTFVDGGDNNMPTCYSSDGLTPDAGCDDPQNSVCVGCPHNAFGTGLDQNGQPTKGKRCGDSKKLFVVAPDGLDGDVYEISVPPTSLKYTAAKKYPGTNMQSLGVVGNQLGAQSLPAYAVKIALNFVPQEASPVLTFRISGYLSAEEFATVKGRLDSGEISGMLPSHNKQPAEVVPQLAAPEGPAATAAPAPEAQLPPCPLGAPAGHYMLEAAGGATYESHIAANWTDETLIQHGKMS